MCTRSIPNRGCRQEYLRLRGEGVGQEIKLMKLSFFADLTKEHGKLKLRLDIPGRAMNCSLSKKDYAALEEFWDSEDYGNMDRKTIICIRDAITK